MLNMDLYKLMETEMEKLNKAFSNTKGVLLDARKTYTVEIDNIKADDDQLLVSCVFNDYMSKSDNVGLYCNWNNILNKLGEHLHKIYPDVSNKNFNTQLQFGDTDIFMLFMDTVDISNRKISLGYYKYTNKFILTFLGTETYRVQPDNKDDNHIIISAEANNLDNDFIKTYATKLAYDKFLYMKDLAKVKSSKTEIKCKCDNSNCLIKLMHEDLMKENIEPPKQKDTKKSFSTYEIDTVFGIGFPHHRVVSHIYPGMAVHRINLNTKINKNKLKHWLDSVHLSSTNTHKFATIYLDLEAATNYIKKSPDEIFREYKNAIFGDTEKILYKKQSEYEYCILVPIDEAFKKTGFSINSDELEVIKTFQVYE